MSAPKRVALNDVAVIERDIVDPTAIETGTLYVGLENIESGGRFVGVRPVDAGELASSKFAFTPQHLLYGKLRPYLAKIARPDFEGICSTDILPILPGRDLDRSYLAWLLLRLFTLSELYDRDRSAFYAALQAVREQGMDLTGWLEFFASGLAAQMEEVKARGTAAIRRDLLVREHRLNERQGRAIEFLMGSPQMGIADFEALCPDVSRRSLQRDLSALEAKGLIRREGETNQLVYRATEKL